MDYSEFLARCLCLDLETGENGDIIAIGALSGDHVFTAGPGRPAGHSLADLDRFARPAAYLLGHNLLGHDLPILRASAPELRLLDKPVVDTLYLSPLAFPQNPYHRLVKDYKLVRDSLNDPVADARLAASVFRDQWESLDALAASEPGLLSFYRYAFAGGDEYRGLRLALEAMGAIPVTAADARDLFVQYSRGRVCAGALREILSTGLDDAARRPALAYALAWLRVAGGNSVLPPWVRLRFADVAPILRQLRDVPCGDRGCGYCSETHDPDRQLRRYFGFDAFRDEPADAGGGSLQRAIVQYAMGDRPLFAVLPTGGGKSLCYQLPALVRYQRRGVLTVVISPLQALMRDQVDNLRNKTGAPNAAALNGLLTAPERGEVLKGVQMGDVALLYASPEQLRNRGFRDAIRHREIGCWVFDEAHCLSKWGHDFRPDYLYAARFIKEFSQRHQTLLPPVQCFTATAKQDVRDEIIDHFHSQLGQMLKTFEGGVERDNLRFEVQTVASTEKHPRLCALLAERLPPERPGCAIVYCATQKNTEEAAEYLQKQGWPAQAFHAGLDAAHKKHVQDDFIAGRTRVICATNAFGMGIDKEDVRLVVHADIPGSLENYLQEAGRAGRDRRDAECVLLYDEDDIETQFKLSALSRLNHRDIARLLKVLRKCKRDREGNVVITAGELLRDETMEDSIDPADRNAATKVVTAISWLERAGFLERNENRTQVFQGRPLVHDLAAAEKKIEKLGLSERQRARWLSILGTLMNADGDRGFSADELAEASAFERDPMIDGRDGETESQRVLRSLYDMANAGLIRKSLLLSAFVRYRVANHAGVLLEEVCRLERAMLDALREEAPDADAGVAQVLSLRRLNQHLLDQGFEKSCPETLRNLLHSLSLDGQGLAGSRGSLDFRYLSRDQYRVTLQRDWTALRETAERRQAAAKTVLDAILARIPEGTPPGADILVEFAAEDLLGALQHDAVLAGKIKDPLAAVDRALMFLHEQRVITLQKGLAVFRQSMTIRVAPEAKGRRYGKGDYEPLAQHYGERIFQVHVMNEYARKGLEKIGQALAFVVAYFSQDKAAFVKRYFAGRAEILARATSGQSFQRIVDDLKNPEQIAVVAAPEDDNVLILAGPGSGKTRIVVHRCAYLLRVKRVRPQSILVLCFNRNAVTELRRRLRQLAGDEAAGVTVQTYHGLALRLTGHALSGPPRTGTEAGGFERMIRDAVSMLRGETPVLGVEADELRDRLLGGCRHILVDEYQDIDEDQYQLISAVAGRTLNDPDSTLSILAVGDDDQNIYQFRGANVAYIRRFEDDYRARRHYLVENYRSSGHIIAAANALVAANRDRMKTDHPIRINRGRKDLSPGGRWTQLDPLSAGRVQVIACGRSSGQARAVLDELLRLRRLQGGVTWDRCAVLAREWAQLDPVRGLCETLDIPVCLTVPGDRLPPPFRIRENLLFLEALKARGNPLVRASHLVAELRNIVPGHPQNPWLQQLARMLADWQAETGDAELPLCDAVEYVCECLAEGRRDRRLGAGMFLSTAHGAKGMEFDHVFILDGGWGRPSEDERRLYYVAMTRARETLCLMRRDDCRNPFVDTLAGDFLLRRRPDIPEPATSGAGTRYVLLGPMDIHLGHAARFPEGHPVHRRLAELQWGDRLRLAAAGHHIFLMVQDTPVAALSKAARSRWRERLERVVEVRVLAMLRRYREDGDGAYPERAMVDSWEVPMVEILYRADNRQQLSVKAGDVHDAC